MFILHSFPLQKYFYKVFFTMSNAYLTSNNYYFLSSQKLSLPKTCSPLYREGVRKHKQNVWFCK